MTVQVIHNEKHGQSVYPICAYNLVLCTIYYSLLPCTFRYSCCTAPSIWSSFIQPTARQKKNKQKKKRMKKTSPSVHWMNYKNLRRSYGKQIFSIFFFYGGDLRRLHFSTMKHSDRSKKGVELWKCVVEWKILGFNRADGGRPVSIFFILRENYSFTNLGDRFVDNGLFRQFLWASFCTGDFLPTDFFTRSPNLRIRDSFALTFFNSGISFWYV